MDSPDPFIFDGKGSQLPVKVEDRGQLQQIAKADEEHSKRQEALQRELHLRVQKQRKKDQQ